MPEAAAAHRLAAPEFVVHGTQGGRGAGRQRRPRTPRPPTRRRPGSTAIPRHRRLSHRRLGAQRADPAGAQRALLGRQAADSSASSSATSATARRRLLAVRRGDIDAAFNLIPEQIATLKTEPNVRLEPLQEPRLRLHGADAGAGVQQGARRSRKRARRSATRIDYDGIINIDARRRGATAGALPADRRQTARPRRSTRKIGFKQDLAKAKELLAKAGLPTASSSRSTTATPRCRA